MSQPSVAIIVINYNGAAVLEDLAASLAAITYTNHRLCLVDNASPDGSGTRLRTLFPNAEIILNDVNTGYAAAVNQAAGICLTKPTDYVLLLNPDTTLPPGFLDSLVESADASTLVSPKVLATDTGRLATHSGGFSWLRGRLTHTHDGEQDGPAHTSPREVEVACFACILIPAAAFAAIGPLDERFGMYYEDTDYSIRARKAGFRILIQPAAIIHHSHGGSSGRDSPFTLYYAVRNRPFTLRKHLSLPRYLLFSVYFLATHARQVAGEVRTRNWPLLRAHLRGLRDFYTGRMGMTYQPSDLNPPNQRY
ncbi:MAG: glycosyltransferase [Dehalococcoidia bacterium]|nr:glycosyltransferase [Dehalococcoidia bacterium]